MRLPDFEIGGAEAVVRGSFCFRSLPTDVKILDVAEESASMEECLAICTRVRKHIDEVQNESLRAGPTIPSNVSYSSLRDILVKLVASLPDDSRNAKSRLG